ncbi:DNA polymerase iota-like [Homalodisca vitripennis]|uniref:DNA polymerase iota-like n=1 Tax=Homalodisca vitripennis TaxID=197043 RepID=UPI001EEA192C|nr:DNA polymerase iota-like [Homalodisca vitripennis]
MDEFRSCDDLQHDSKYKHKRTIIHIDLDCFYAQVEMLKNPELTDKPVGIKQQHYVITSNYVAREYGIKKCMLITEALSLCPKLIIINGEDLHDYRLMSSKVTDIVRQFSTKVEKLGLDENFVDISDMVSSKLASKDNHSYSVVGHIYKNEIENICACGCRERLVIGSNIASEIRARIREELGMTCCAGVGHNKLLAKLVGSTHKPNQQTIVFPCSATLLVSNLSHARKIPGIGRKTSDVLDALGIVSVHDVQNCSLKVLEKHFDKSVARWIKGACFGVDDTDVKESGKQQVIGLEEASKMIGSMEEVRNRLKSLIDRGMVLLEEDGRFPTTIRVAVRKYSSHEEYCRQRESKQCPINPSIFRSNIAKDHILEAALGLFKKLVDHTKPFHLTLIGLAFTKFQEELPVKSSMLQFLRKKSLDESSSKDLTITDTSVGSTIENIVTGDNDQNSDFNRSNDSKQEHISFGEIDESVLNELPEDIRSEIMQTFQHENKPGTSSSNDTSVKCPPGIKLEVFNELPHEIQLELVRDSYKNTSNTVKTTGLTSKRQNSILNYLKKK